MNSYNCVVLTIITLITFTSGIIESKPTESTESCSSCENLVKFSSKLYDVLQIDEIRKDIINWCVESNLGDNAKMCEFVLNNTENALRKVDSSHFCHGVEACHSHHNNHQRTPKFNSQLDDPSTDCEFCLNTLTHIKEIISSPATANEIKSLLSTGCENLRELKNECLRLIDEELDTIFKFIRDQFDPRQFCIETHSCPPREMAAHQIDKNLPQLTDFINILPQASVVIIHSNPIAASSSPQCTVCHLIYRLIDQELKKNSTVAEIEKVLDSVCAKVFKDVSKISVCQERVEKYTKQFIDLASSGASAEVACLIAGVCEIGESKGKPVTNPIVMPKSSFECELCQQLFEYLYKFLDGKRAQEAIESALDKVCDKIFSGDRVIVCENYVKNFTPLITEIIVKTSDPKEACAYLNLCGSASVESSINLTPLSSKAVSVKTEILSDCSHCVDDIQLILTNLTSQRQRDVPELMKACLQLEKTEGQCSAYIAMINATFDILEKNIHPEGACTLYGACNKYTSYRMSKKLFTGERENSNKQLENNNVDELKLSVCSQCQALARYIEEKVSDYHTEEEISEFIKNDVCGQIPNEGLKETCQSFMVEYGDSFIYKIALKIFDPTMVCSKELHVCPSSNIDSVDKSSDIELIADTVGSTCDLCVDMVTKIESVLPNGNSSYFKLVNQVCQQFDSKENVEKCKILYDAFGSHFITMIGYDSPKKICTIVDICYDSKNFHLLGGKKCTFGPSYWCHTSDHAEACKATNFCKKNVWKAVEQKDSVSIQDTPQCVLCHLFLNIIEKELEKNSTVEEIEAILENACRKIYKDETKLAQCQDRVEKYTKRFIDMSTHGVAPEVACIVFGFCHVGEDSQGAACLKDSKVTCPICKSVVEKVYQTISENKTKEEIDQALENACNLMPDSEKQACLVYIKMYDEKLAELIAETADAEEVCRKIGLCSEHDEVTESVELADPTYPECVLCKRIFEYVYAYLQGNRTQEKIQEALDKVCDDVFPGSRKKDCRKFIETYTGQIIDIVLQTTDPKEVCILLNMCKQKAKYNAEELGEVDETVEIVPLTKLTKASLKPDASQQECDRCRITFSSMSLYFSDLASKINNEVEKACIKYYKDAVKCRGYMATYFDSATSSLMSETSSDYLCINLLNMCPASSVERENSIVTDMLDKKLVTSNEVEIEGKPRIICAECEMFVKYIQSRIYNFKTEEEISKFIKNDVCTHFLTRELRESCKSFMNEYGDSIIQMIALKIFDPEVFCSKELKLCSSPPPTNKNTVIKTSSSSEFDFIDSKIEQTCNLCIDMVKKIEEKSHDTHDKESETSTKDICSQYESSEKNQKCQSMYEAFGKHFLTMIAFQSAEKICSAVDLCYDVNTNHLLGGNKCIFGPVYWCNTKAHAEACNALGFCQTSDWLPIE